MDIFVSQLLSKIQEVLQKVFIWEEGILRECMCTFAFLFCRLGGFF